MAVIDEREDGTAIYLHDLPPVLLRVKIVDKTPKEDEQRQEI